ncbi:MAG: glycosyltransferase family 9 protein [Desulfobacteraceae bacterium]|nr:glycosyltransferase family 9 protein [Desulfobacteraceae bacterium]
MKTTGNPKILIVKLSAIGDVVHTLPALNALRRHYPQAHITWLVEEAAAGFIQGHHALNRVLISKRKKWIKGLASPQRRTHWQAIRRFLRQLRDTRYDLIIDFQFSLKGALWIALAHGRRKIGFGPGMQHQEHSHLVLNERIPSISMQIHALDRGLRLLEGIGIPKGPVEYAVPISNDDRNKVNKMLIDNGWRNKHQTIAINPMAKWDTKLWLPERFAQLADSLIDRHGVTIFFTGGPEDVGVISQIQRHMRNKAKNMAGRTSLVQLAAMYEQMACVVSTDTGPMHIAAAVGAPAVALFGPTAPWRTGPHGQGHKVLQTNLLDCVPCFQRHCEPHHCMQAITVEQVQVAVADILKIGN